MKSTVFVIFVLALGGLAACRGEIDAQQPQVHLSPLVVVPRNASEAHKAAAKDLALFLGVDHVTETDWNPVCCTWIEKKPDLPKPGYIIVNKEYGTMVLASDDEQIKAAIH